LIGVAPKAYLGNYKVSDANGSTIDVIVKAIDDAVADGMDVLNLSLGGYVASYSDADLRDPAVAAIEAATNAGVIVTVSAGNDGPGPTSLANLASAPDAISVGAIRNDRTFGYAVTTDGTAPYPAYIGNGAHPANAVTGPLLDIAGLDPTGLACSPLPDGSATGMVVLVLRGTCTFEDKINHVATGGALGAVIYNSETGAIFQIGTQAVGRATLPTLFMNRADGVALQAQIAATPGLNVTLGFWRSTGFAQRTDLTAFSSRGPSLGTALKPDLVAVGQDIVTAGQNTFPNGELYTPSGFLNLAGTSYSAPLTAGAAALLKGARPGLTVAQYRSLLINSATPATAGVDLPATIAQAGAGVLNVAAALQGSIGAYPTALNFGAKAGPLDQSLNLTISNLGTASDTYAVSVVPSGDGPTPMVSSDSFTIDSNDSRPVFVSLTASGLAAGEYQGYVKVTGNASQSVATIPYWFAVPGNTPKAVAALYTRGSITAGSNATGAVVFRVVDVAGLPLSSTAFPTASVSIGGGTVRGVYRTGTVPGTYAIDLRAGTSTMQVDITVGDITQSVVVGVQ